MPKRLESRNDAQRKEGSGPMLTFSVFLPKDLHPATQALVVGFAEALGAKLRAAEKKYGYDDGWQGSAWMDECRAKLREHIEKGDPRDVAAYCAFLWHHGESTALATRSEKQESKNCDVCGVPPADPCELKMLKGHCPRNAPLSATATPRVDADPFVRHFRHTGTEAKFIELARQLERELAAFERGACCPDEQNCKWKRSSTEALPKVKATWGDPDWLTLKFENADDAGKVMDAIQAAWQAPVYASVATESGRRVQGPIQDSASPTGSEKP